MPKVKEVCSQPIYQLCEDYQSLSWFKRLFFPSRLGFLLGQIIPRTPICNDEVIEICKSYKQDTWFWQRWLFSFLNVFASSEVYQNYKKNQYITDKEKSNYALQNAIFNRLVFQKISYPIPDINLGANKDGLHHQKEAFERILKLVENDGKTLLNWIKLFEKHLPNPPIYKRSNNFFDTLMNFFAISKESSAFSNELRIYEQIHNAALKRSIKICELTFHVKDKIRKLDGAEQAAQRAEQAEIQERCHQAKMQKLEDERKVQEQYWAAQKKQQQAKMEKLMEELEKEHQELNSELSNINFKFGS